MNNEYNWWEWPYGDIEVTFGTYGEIERKPSTRHGDWEAEWKGIEDIGKRHRIFLFKWTNGRPTHPHIIYWNPKKNRFEFDIDLHVWLTDKRKDDWVQGYRVADSMEQVIYILESFDRSYDTVVTEMTHREAFPEAYRIKDAVKKNSQLQGVDWGAEDLVSKMLSEWDAEDLVEQGDGWGYDDKELETLSDAQFEREWFINEHNEGWHRNYFEPECSLCNEERSIK